MRSILYRQTAMALAMLLGAAVLPAQQYDEKTVNKEKAFIEASREKLLGNDEKAIEMYDKLLKEDSQNDVVAYELARLRDARGQTPEAMELLEKAIAINPNNIWYKILLGEVYQKLGRPKQAAAMYESLAKADPRNSEYHYKWAFFLVQQRDAAGAIKVYDLLEGKVGINEELVRRKHALYLGEGNAKKAGRELERLIDAFPANVNYRFLMATFYEQTNNAKAAEATYRDILKIDPNNSRARLALAGDTKKTGSDAANVAALGPIFQQADLGIDAKIARIYPLIGRVADTGDRELADALLSLTDILQRVHPSEAKGFAAAGDLLYHSGRPQEALQKYQQTIQLDETVFAVWEQVMLIHAQAADHKQLAATTEEALDIYPNKAAVYQYSGIAHRELGRFGDAVADLQTGLRISASDPQMQFELQTELGKTYNRQANYAKAEAALAAALQLNPQHPITQAEYAVALALQDKVPAQVNDLLKSANAAAPASADCQWAYAQVLYHRSDLNGAKAWLDKAVANGGEAQARISELYGDVLFKMGDQAAALQYWRRADQRGGGSPLLDKKIKENKRYE